MRCVLISLVLFLFLSLCRWLVPCRFQRWLLAQRLELEKGSYSIRSAGSQIYHGMWGLHHFRLLEVRDPKREIIMDRLNFIYAEECCLLVNPHWPLRWRISLSVRVQTTLDMFFYYNSDQSQRKCFLQSVTKSVELYSALLEAGLVEGFISCNSPPPMKSNFFVTCLINAP